MPISIFFSIIIEYNNEKNYNNKSVIKIPIINDNDEHSIIIYFTMITCFPLYEYCVRNFRASFEEKTLLRYRSSLVNSDIPC